tara:strand:+ start:1038 stop:1148 length:111 start_codon:yes stop_codon:yes gene_type:complete
VEDKWERDEWERDEWERDEWEDYDLIIKAILHLQDR